MFNKGVYMFASNDQPAFDKTAWNKFPEKFQDDLNTIYFDKDLYEGEDWEIPRTNSGMCFFPKYYEQQLQVDIQALGNIYPPLLERITTYYRHIIRASASSYCIGYTLADATSLYVRMNPLLVKEQNAEIYIKPLMKLICPDDPLEVAGKILVEFNAYHNKFNFACPNENLILELGALAKETINCLKKNPSVIYVEKLLTAMHVCKKDGNPLITDNARNKFIYHILKSEGQPSLQKEREFIKKWVVHQECRTPFIRTLRSVARLALDFLMRKKLDDNEAESEDTQKILMKHLSTRGRAIYQGMDDCEEEIDNEKTL